MDIVDLGCVAMQIAHECSFSVREVYVVLTALNDEAKTRKLVKIAEEMDVSLISLLTAADYSFVE